MATDIIEAWEQFKTVLKLYGKAHSLLNPPCSISNINKIEGKFDFELPSPLKILLTQNNGQQVGNKEHQKGIFKRTH